MKYRIQKGLVMEEICGVALLISTVEAREKCPYLTELNESSLFVWNMISDGKNTDEMVKDISEEYHLSMNDAEEILSGFLNNLENQNFIEKECC